MAPRIGKACAVVCLPLALLGGCSDRATQPAASSELATPAILQELRDKAPGPWRLQGAPIVAARPIPIEPASANTPADEPSDDQPIDAPAPDTIDSSNLPSEPASEPVAPIEVPVEPAAEAVTAPDVTPERTVPAAKSEEVAPVADDVTPSAAKPADDEKPADSSVRFVPAESAKPAEVVEQHEEAEPRSRGLRPAVDAPPERTTLPWAVKAPRTSEMVAVMRRASERVHHGFQLAQRGAFYSAKTDFIAALQLVASANDAQRSTRFYGRALVAGLDAMKEAGDFSRHNPREPEIDVARIVAGHKTTVLKNIDTQDMSPVQAAGRYYSYAQEQLTAAAAQELSASMALYGLGKIALATDDARRTLQIERTAQAMTLYQASLMTSPQNFRSANELGVLLAENGNYERARDMLVRSATQAPHAVTLNNLSVVHARLGQAQLAESARQRADELAAAGQLGNAPAVKWIGTEEFARSIPPSDALTPLAAPPRTVASSTPAPAAPPVAAQAPVEAKPAENVARKGSDWLPRPTRR